MKSLKGGGLLFHNDKKQEGDKTPDYRTNIGGGRMEIDGQEIAVEFALWKKLDKNGKTFLSLSISLPREPVLPPKQPATKDDLPF